MNPSIPVLCYHAVGVEDGHSRERFAEHLDAIKDLGFTTVPASYVADVALGRAKPEKKRVCITFDDGHVSNWLDCAPMLKKRGMVGTFFLVTDFLVPGGIRTPGEVPAPASSKQAFVRALGAGDYTNFLNISEAEAMLDMGMEVFSHSATHARCFRNLSPRHEFAPGSHWGLWGIYGRSEPDPSLPEFEGGSAYVCNGFWPVFENGRLKRFKRRTDAQREAFCLEEFTRSLEAVRRVNGLERQLFCWPWGHFDDLSVKALRRAGYVAAFSLERGFTGPGSNPFTLARIGVGKNKSASWLASRLRMYSSPVVSRLAVKRWRKPEETARVAYASNSRLASGGSRQLVNNARAMADMGLDTRVFVPAHSEIAAELEGSDIAVTPFSYDSPLRTMRFLLKTCREKRIDVLHVFHSRPLKPALAAKWLGMKAKLFINRGVIYKPNPLFGLWAALGNGITCNSETCARVLRRYLAPKSRLNVILNAYAKDAPPPAERTGPPKVLFVGNMAEVKGFDVFARAVALLKEQGRDAGAGFTALGIEKKDQFADRVPAIGLEAIRSPGHVGHEEVMAELNRTHVFVLASRQESMPNALVEAMAAGCAVVATSVGGVPELVRDGINGLLCPSGDHSCLAERLAGLLVAPATMAEMGRINHRLVRSFLNLERKGFELMRLYEGGRVRSHLPVEEVASGAFAEDFWWTAKD